MYIYIGIHEQVYIDNVKALNAVVVVAVSRIRRSPSLFCGYQPLQGLSSYVSICPPASDVTAPVSLVDSVEERAAIARAFVVVML